MEYSESGMMLRGTRLQNVIEVALLWRSWNVYGRLLHEADAFHPIW